MLRSVVTAICIAAFLLAGCSAPSGKGEDITSIRFDREGVITHTVIEPFDDGDYDVEELKEMIAGDISDMGEENGISLKSASEKDGEITVVMTYADYERFMMFNDETVFFGSIGEAEDAGYKMRDGNFVNAKEPDGSTMGAFDDKEKIVIITSLKTEVFTPQSIAFMSEGTALHAEREADASAVKQDLVYLILEKQTGRTSK